MVVIALVSLTSDGSVCAEEGSVGAAAAAPSGALITGSGCGANSMFGTAIACADLSATLVAVSVSAPPAAVDATRPRAMHVRILRNIRLGPKRMSSVKRRRGLLRKTTYPRLHDTLKK